MSLALEKPAPRVSSGSPMRRFSNLLYRKPNLYLALLLILSLIHI